MRLDLRTHMKNVSEISYAIGLEVGMCAKEVENLCKAAYLHDIGKIKIIGSIVNKNSTLTDDEMKIIKQHSKLGADLLKRNKYNDKIVKAVLYHHERYDGKGYPEGLKKNEIPFFSRIISVADSYDAMISRRTYKTPMPRSKVLKEIMINSGKQFDPEIVKKFFQTDYGRQLNYLDAKIKNTRCF